MGYWGTGEWRDQLKGGWKGLLHKNFIILHQLHKNTHWNGRRTETKGRNLLIVSNKYLRAVFAKKVVLRKFVHEIN